MQKRLKYFRTRKVSNIRRMRNKQNKSKKVCYTFSSVFPDEKTMQKAYAVLNDKKDA